MDRQPPRAISDEIDLYIRTYYSLLRSSGEGSADLYPRFGRTMEWDTAAGHAVLAAAGGRVRTLRGEDLLYGKPGFENPHFIASA